MQPGRVIIQATFVHCKIYERGQHIIVRKLDLLTWGVLLARVLVKTDVSREESMISLSVFPATVHAAPTATERRSYHVI